MTKANKRKEGWEKEFDDKFKMSLLPLIPMIPNRRIDLEIKQFISQAIQKTREEILKEILSLSRIIGKEDFEYEEGPIEIVLTDDILNSLRNKQK